MAEQHEAFTRAGAEVITVLNDSVEHGRAYFQQHPIPFLCLIDQEHSVYDRYQVESKALSLGQRPGLFVVDEDGVVRYSHIGWQQWEIPNNAGVLEVCRSIHCGADAVAARLTVRGTYKGDFEGTPPTGKPIMFTDMRAYRIVGSKLSVLQ